MTILELTDAVIDTALEKYSPLLARCNVEPEEAEATSVLADEDEVVRTNGERYFPRTIVVNDKSFVDVAVLRSARDNKMPVLLYGDPGTGKTALVEAAFGEDLVTLQGSGETEVADFVGSWTQQPDGTYLWVDGPLVKAADAGVPFLIDECAIIDPRSMAVVYSVMDGRNEIVVTANPERGTVKAKPGFYVIGACNPNVPGAIMSDALLSRFSIHVEVSIDWQLVSQLGVKSKFVTIAKNLHIKAKSGELAAPPQVRELIACREIEKTFGIDFALANLVAQAREQDRETYTTVIQSVTGVAVQPLAVGI